MLQDPKVRRSLGALLPILRECNFRRNHPFYSYTPDRHPDGDQYGFHRSEAPTRLILGGNQSGKSRAVAQEIAWWLTEAHPLQPVPQAPRIYLVSASYRTVQEGVYRHLKTCLPRWLIETEGQRVSGYKFPQYIQMKTGGQVDFLSGEGAEDARRKAQAAECHLVVVDEEVDFSLWEEFQARRLHFGGRAIIAATLVRSEPWIMELEDRAEARDPHVHLTRLSTYRAAERGHVSVRQLKEMEATMSESDRQVRLLGQSRRYEGLVYQEFSRKHVVPPFPIPHTWTRYCALDPGFRTFAVLWFAVAPEGKYVIYRELYWHGANYREVCKEILRLEGYSKILNTDTWKRVEGQTELMRLRWIDPAAFGHTEAGEMRVGSLMATYSRELGVGSALACAPAQNDVDVGIEYCRRSLMKDMDNIPRMRVFETCPHFIKECRNYRFQRDNKIQTRREPAQKPIKRADHAMDAWRYAELGGLTHVPYEQLLRRVALEDNPLFGQYTTPAEERVKEHWKEILAKQRDPWRARSDFEHPGGIGVDY